MKLAKIALSTFLGLGVASFAAVSAVVALTPEQQGVVDDANDLLSDMETVRAEVEELRQQEEDGGGDATKLQCINEKLTQISAHMNVAQESIEGIEVAFGRDDTNTALQGGALVMIAHQQVLSLGQAAVQCTGSSSSFTGTTELQYTDSTVLARANAFWAFARSRSRSRNTWDQSVHWTAAWSGGNRAGSPIF